MYVASSYCQAAKISIGILDLEEVGAGLGTGVFRLMLLKVAQHPGNGSSS